MSSADGTMRSTVLIYPYWNVNKKRIYVSAVCGAVLIYPYWNVNVDRLRDNHVITMRFNLSILECKFSESDIAKWNSGSFNLSILECKLHQPASDIVVVQRFNLSILECK